MPLKGALHRKQNKTRSGKILFFFRYKMQKINIFCVYWLKSSGPPHGEEDRCFFQAEGEIPFICLKTRSKWVSVS